MILNTSANRYGFIDYDIGISHDIDENYRIFKQIFNGDDTVVIRLFENRQNPQIRYLGISVNGMVKTNSIYQSITSPLITMSFDGNGDRIDAMAEKMITSLDIKVRDNISDIVTDVLYGDTAIFVSGSNRAITVETKGFSTRSISEPDNERGLKGSKEGFTEALIVNTSMIRRRILSSDLKFEFFRMGSRTNTLVCVAYMDSLIDKRMLTEFLRRLKKIRTDGILDTNYIDEQIKDRRHSPFKTCGSTEKPDIVAAQLLEGRVALIVDGTPIVLTAPYLFIENFQSPDDYYLNFWFASIGRIIRIIGFFITISLPSIYLALVTYHSEMLPNTFLNAIAEASRGVPFPTFLECVFMLFVFEILRETGIRMPSKVGQALSIVGGLVVGQAAVEAKIVSAPMVIVVAFTGITGLCVPRLSGAAIIIRTLALVSTAMLGFYGFFGFMIIVLIHLLSVKSFGYDYVTLAFGFQDIKDIYFRAPHDKMRTRPIFAKDKIRK